MASWRTILSDGAAKALGLYERGDYGGEVDVHPNQTTKISNRQGRVHAEAYGGNQPVDWVMDCVRLISETASNAEFYFEKDGKRLLAPDSKDTDGEKAPTDLYGLLSDPNPYQDYVELIELAIIDLLLAGEFFWLKHKPDDQGRPLALYRLSPALMEVIAHPKKFIDRYEFTPSGQSVPLKFKPEEIIHAKLPNPHNEYRGLGVIAGGPRVYDVELSLTESLAQYYEQGTRLSGVVSTDRRVPESVFQRIRRQFANMYSGARNAYKVAVLENNLKFTPIQATAADAMYVEVSKLSRDRILHMFRVPKPLIGNMEEANYKMAEAQRVFDTKTMRPFLNRLERIVTRSLTSAWDVKFKIDYNYVMPDEDRLKLAEGFALLPGVKVKEVRRQAGLDPLGTDEDDVILNMPPTEEEKQAELELKYAQPPLGGEGGRPPGTPSKGSGVPRSRGTLPTSQARVRERQSQKKAQSDVDALLDPLKSARRPTVELLAYNIARELGPVSRELEKDLEKVIRGDSKAASDLVKKVKNARAWRVFSARATSSLMKLAEAAVEAARNQHRLIGFEQSNISATGDRNDPVMIASDLVGRENGIKSIVGTLKGDVVDMIAEGQRRNYSTDQIVSGVHTADESYDGISGLLIGWRQSHLETIAATEAQEYYNEGVLRIAEANDNAHVIVLDGEDYDAPCIDANGQVWTIEQARERRTEHPNCTRTFYPVDVGIGGKAQAETPAHELIESPAGPMQIHVNVEPAQVNVEAKAPNVTVEPAQVDAHVTIEPPAQGPRTVKVVEGGKVVKEYREG